MSNHFNWRYSFLVRPGMPIGLLKRGNRNSGLQRLMFGSFHKTIQKMRETVKDPEEGKVWPLSRVEYGVMCSLQDRTDLYTYERVQLEGLEERFRLTDGVIVDD